MQQISNIRKVCHTVARQAHTLHLKFAFEEFVILLPNTDRTNALHIAERLRSTLAATPISVANQELAITISLGVATMQGKNCNLK